MFISLLFEFVFQRGALSSLLQILVLCMKLSSAGLVEYYPLVKFLKKFAYSVLHKNYVPEILEMVWQIIWYGMVWYIMCPLL